MDPGFSGLQQAIYETANNKYYCPQPVAGVCTRVCTVYMDNSWAGITHCCSKGQTDEPGEACRRTLGASTGMSARQASLDNRPNSRQAVHTGKQQPKNSRLHDGRDTHRMLPRVRLPQRAGHTTRALPAPQHTLYTHKSNGLCHEACALKDCVQFCPHWQANNSVPRTTDPATTKPPNDNTTGRGQQRMAADG